MRSGIRRSSLICYSGRSGRFRGSFACSNIPVSRVGLTFFLLSFLDGLVRSLFFLISLPDFEIPSKIDAIVTSEGIYLHRRMDRPTRFLAIKTNQSKTISVIDSGKGSHSYSGMMEEGTRIVRNHVRITKISP